MPDYTNLINKGGTIYDTQTGTGFASEAELREARNITGPTQWGQIVQNDNWTFQGTTNTGGSGPGGAWTLEDTAVPGFPGSANITTPPTPGDLGGSTLPANIPQGDTVDNSNNVALNLTGGETTAQLETNINTLVQQLLDEQKETRDEQKDLHETAIEDYQAIEAPNYQELYNQTLEQYGFTPEEFQHQKDLETQIANYASQIASIGAAEAQAVIGAQQETAPLAYTQGKAALIRRQAAAEKAGLAAQAGVLQMQYDMGRGRLEDAQNMAATVIDNATHQYQQNIKDFEAMYNLHSDYINTLSEADQQIIETAYNANVTALETRTNEIQANMDLIQRAAEAGVNLTFDPLTTSAEDALAMYTEKVSAQARIDNTTGTTTTDKLLTPAEAKSFGDPYGTYRSEVVGQIPGQLPENAPGWFIQRENQKAGVSLTPQNLGVLWTEYKTAQESKNNIASAWSIF